RRKRGIFLLPVEKVRIADRSVFKINLLFVKNDEPVRIRVGKRLHKHAMHNGKHRCIRADAQRQRQYNNVREPPILPELAQAVANVLPETVQCFSVRAKLLLDFWNALKPACDRQARPLQNRLASHRSDLDTDLQITRSARPPSDRSWWHGAPEYSRR